MPRSVVMDGGGQGTQCVHTVVAAAADVALDYRYPVPVHTYQVHDYRT